MDLCKCPAADVSRHAPAPWRKRRERGTPLLFIYQGPYWVTVKTPGLVATPP